jgi:hypothetical protein
MKRVYLASVLMLLAVPLAFAGVWNAPAAPAPAQLELTAADHLANWGDSMDAVDQIALEDEVFVPNRYYVDDFGAFYFNDAGYRIYPAASTDLTPTAVVGKAYGSGSGWGGGGSGGGSSASCWQFAFRQNGFSYPNPSNTTYGFKADLDLLVLDTNYQFHNASLRAKVYNISGQLIADNSLGSYPSNPDFTVTTWNANAASGTYFIRITATSSLCGSRTIENKVTVIN